MSETTDQARKAKRTVVRVVRRLVRLAVVVEAIIDIYAVVFLVRLIVCEVEIRVGPSKKRGGTHTSR